MAVIKIDTATLEVTDNGDWVNVDISTLANAIAKAVLAEHGIKMPYGFNLATGKVKQGVVRLGMTARQAPRKPLMEKRQPEPVTHVKPEAAPVAAAPDMAAMFQQLMAMMQNGGMPQAAPNVVPAPVAKAPAKVGRPVGSGLRRKAG